MQVAADMLLICGRIGVPSHCLDPPCMHPLLSPRNPKCITRQVAFLNCDASMSMVYLPLPQKKITQWDDFFFTHIYPQKEITHITTYMCILSHISAPWHSFCLPHFIRCICLPAPMALAPPTRCAPPPPACPPLPSLCLVGCASTFVMPRFSSLPLHSLPPPMPMQLLPTKHHGPLNLALLQALFHKDPGYPLWFKPQSPPG